MSTCRKRATLSAVALSRNYRSNRCVAVALFMTWQASLQGCEPRFLQHVSNYLSRTIAFLAVQPQCTATARAMATACTSQVSLSALTGMISCRVNMMQGELLLSEAADAGNMGEVERLLSSGIDVNARDSTKYGGVSATTDRIQKRTTQAVLHTVLATNHATVCCGTRQPWAVVFLL